MKVNTLSGTRKTKILQTGYLTRKPPSWLKPEDFGFGHPLTRGEGGRADTPTIWEMEKCTNCIMYMAKKVHIQVVPTNT